MRRASEKVSLFFATGLFRAMELLRRAKEAGMTKDTTTAEAGKIYSFEMKTIEGRSKPLSDYKGQVLLVVNTASLCGFTPQYEALEKLHQEYKDRGLRLLAFPANEFGAQEPGTDAEIKSFCQTRYSVSFELFSKIRVKGDGIHPLYRFLTTESGFNGEIPWNFAKFLVDRQGRVTARFGPAEDPLSKKVLAKVSEALASAGA